MTIYSAPDEPARQQLLTAVNEAFGGRAMPTGRMFSQLDGEAKRMMRYLGRTPWQGLAMNERKLPVLLAICLLEPMWFVYYLPAFISAACRSDAIVAGSVLLGLDPSSSGPDYMVGWVIPRVELLTPQQSEVVCKFIRLFMPPAVGSLPRYEPEERLREAVEALVAVWAKPPPISPSENVAKTDPT